METIFDLIATLKLPIEWLIANYETYVGAVVGASSALIVLFMLIPGEQPEKFLTGVVNFLSKFSRKPPELK